MKYKYLIFDVDDTLLDFDDAYHNVVQTIVEEQGMRYSNETFSVFCKCSWAAWNEMHLNDKKHKRTVKFGAMSIIEGLVNYFH